MLTDPCADPKFFPGWSRPDCQKTALTTFFCLFCPQLFSFTVAYQWFISKKTTIVQGFGGGGGGSNLSQGGGLGVQMLILETHRTFDFPEGGPDPLSPLWIHTCDHLTTRN